MRPTADDQRFLARRRWMLRAWPVFRIILAVAILGAGAFLFARSPWVVNPFEAASRIRDGTLEPGTVRLMAAMLPMMFWLCLIVLAAAVLLMESAAAQERRYLKIIERMEEDSRE